MSLRAIRTRIAEWLEASHLFITAMALLMTMESYVMADQPFDWPLIVLVASATGGLYSIHRLLQLHRYRTVEAGRIDVLRRHRGVLRLSLVVYVGVSVLMMPRVQAPNASLSLILALGAAIGLYVLPWSRSGTTIRDLPYVKLVYIAAGWATATYLLPMLWTDGDSVSFIPWWERFIFFMLITIPFDVRDEQIDRTVSLRTTATSLSRSWVRRLLVILWLVHLMILLYYPTDQIYLMILAVCSGVGLWMGWYSWGRRWPYFSFGLDGLIGLRLILWWIALVLS